jgi:hypothetical protein
MNFVTRMYASIDVGYLFRFDRILFTTHMVSIAVDCGTTVNAMASGRF